MPADSPLIAMTEQMMTSHQDRKYTLPSMLAIGTFVMAVAALGLSLWTALSTPIETLPASDRDAATEIVSDATKNSPPPSHPVGASPTASDAQLSLLQAIKRRVTAIEQRQSKAGASHAASAAQLSLLQAIERRVTAIEQHRREAGARATGSAEAASDPAARIDESPQYVELVSPEPSVDVMQGEDGTLFLINSDPALTGKVIEIEAHHADDSIDTITVVVPQPDS